MISAFRAVKNLQFGCKIAINGYTSVTGHNSGNLMPRQFERIPGSAYSVSLIALNGKGVDKQPSINIDNIGKGGFRFSSDAELQLEDRLQVILRFPDGREQEVLGRICYSEEEMDHFSYGFSVLSGFYSLTRVA